MEIARIAFRPGMRAAVSLAALAAASCCLSSCGRVGAQEPRVHRRSGEEIAATNERLYGYRGVITGRVTLNDGKPAVGFPVVARFEHHQSGAQGEGYAITDADGEYRIHGLNPQGFRVQAENGGKPYVPDPPKLVRLERSPGKTTARADFTLRLGPLVTVRVRDAQTGAPVPGVTVKMSPMMGISGPPRGVTDARGELQFRAGTLDLQMSLEPNRGGGQSISAAPGSTFYRGFRLTRVEDVVWDVKTYNDDPSANRATFRGVVTGPDGVPVWGAKVRIARGGVSEPATTDPAGRFAIETHRMQLSEYGNWDGRNRKGILIVAEKGDLFGTHIATPEETWTSIPIRLTRATDRGTVTGRVVDPDGRPLAGVPIRYSASFPEADAHAQKNGGSSGVDGRFTIRGLSPGAYHQFTFGGPPQYGGDPGFGETRVPSAQYVTGWLRLKAGERSRDLGRVTVWRADAVIAGRVVGAKTGASGKKDNLLVLVKGKHTHKTASPDPATGRFRVENVVREPLTLYVFRSDGHSYHLDPGNPDEVTHRSVRAGDEAVSIDLP